MPISRRTLLRLLPAPLLAAPEEKLPPVRAVTKGPKFHWFGYYDKLQFDPSGRYLLGMEVGFENRSPGPDDKIALGMIDLQQGDTWTQIGETSAWCWQQGCMLQWMPGSSTDVIWNDREGDRFVSRILNVKTGKRRTLPGPIYAINPDGDFAVAPDFRRLWHLRPGYGYAGIADPFKDVAAPEGSGIWGMDLRNGKQDMLFSIAELANMKDGHSDFTGAKHWFNHLLFSPSGERFVFLHRWRRPDQTSFSTRMITANADGGDLHILDPRGKTSHFIWRDDARVLAWADHPSYGEKFYLFRDHTTEIAVVGPDVMTENGHCSYLPGKRWILNDTYPDRQRMQHPYLYSVRSNTKTPLGHFLSPAPYQGEWRCDTHPRFSPDGTKVCIDSAHGGDGRQMYVIDISGIRGVPA